MTEPKLKPSHDGIYPRCVWCSVGLYALNVLDYSKGKSDCHNCGESLPKEYVKLYDS